MCKACAIHMTRREVLASATRSIKIGDVVRERHDDSALPGRVFSSFNALDGRQWHHVDWHDGTSSAYHTEELSAVR